MKPRGSRLGPGHRAGRRAWLLAGLAGWAGLAGLGAAARAQEPALVIKIGHAAPTRGWLARLGVENENAARLAIDTLNQRGLRIGGRPVAFELVPADDSGDAARARAVAQSLVAAGVSAVVGHFLSTNNLAAAPVYAAAGVPQISPTATAAAYTRSGWATAFRLLADDVRIGQVLAQHVVSRLGARRMAVVHEASAYGASLSQAFSAAAQRLGATVLQTHPVPAELLDFDELVAGLQQRQPDAVLFVGLDRQAGALLRQLHRAGSKVLMVGGDGVCTPDLVSYWAVGEARDDQVVCALPAGMPGIEDNPPLARFSAEYRRRFGALPEFYGAHVHDAVMLLADAMVRAGTHLASGWLPVLAATRDWPGLTGPIGFDPRGDLIDAPVVIHTYRQEERLPVLTLR